MALPPNYGLIHDFEPLFVTHLLYKIREWLDTWRKCVTPPS